MCCLEDRHLAVAEDIPHRYDYISGRPIIANQGVMNHSTSYVAGQDLAMVLKILSYKCMVLRWRDLISLAQEKNKVLGAYWV